MRNNTLSIEQVTNFVKSREVELVLTRPLGDDELFLKASFDGEGFFFGISFGEVDYVCIPGGVEVRNIQLGQFEDFGKDFAEFSSLRERYSGPALVVEADDDERRYLIVADRIEITKGPDWPET